MSRGRVTVAVDALEALLPHDRGELWVVLSGAPLPRGLNAFRVAGATAAAGSPVSFSDSCLTAAGPAARLSTGEPGAVTGVLLTLAGLLEEKNWSGEIVPAVPVRLEQRHGAPEVVAAVALAADADHDAVCELLAAWWALPAPGATWFMSTLSALVSPLPADWVLPSLAWSLERGDTPNLLRDDLRGISRRIRFAGPRLLVVHRRIDDDADACVEDLTGLVEQLAPHTASSAVHPFTGTLVTARDLEAWLGDAAAAAVREAFGPQPVRAPEPPPPVPARTLPAPPYEPPPAVPDGGGVTIAEEELLDSSGEGTRVLFLTRADPDEALAALAAAGREAIAEVDAPTEDWDEMLVLADDPVITGWGPALYLDEVDSDQAFALFLRSVARRLEAAGLHGRLVPGPNVAVPFSSGAGDLVPTVVVPGETAPPAVTDALLDWCRVEGAELFLFHREILSRIRPAELDTFWARALAAGGTVGIAAWGPGPRIRTAALVRGWSRHGVLAQQSTGDDAADAAALAGLAESFDGAVPLDGLSAEPLRAGQTHLPID